MTLEEIDITPSPRLLAVLGDIPLAPWQCLAELIDNSLDELSRDTGRFKTDQLRVDIEIESLRSGHTVLVIRDNGCGMDTAALTTAVKAGATSKGRYGTLGLFGMGFNIATARLGKSTVVTTSRAGDDELIRTVLDFSELQRTEKFRVPLERIGKEDYKTSGTELRVSLKREMADILSSPRNLEIIRSQLGNVYSYLLRDAVPGISRAHMSAKAPAVVYVAGIRVKAKLPCVWADHRSVQSYGQAVEAIQYIDFALTDATACLVCGYWDRSNGPVNCEECGSSQLELKARRIWGWLGVQRYIDPSHYGIDFLRYGRKVLMQDKSLFRYTDPDTLQDDVEYPIEMPANQGRLVGEIHLDHVPVTYQKNDFDRQHRDWLTAVQILRGDGPLKPRGAKHANTSRLAMLYSAYRRNDPGLRYLTPGDGKTALHSKAREWGHRFFEKEVPKYLDDSEWYEAAYRHDNPQRSPSDAAGPDSADPQVSGIQPDDFTNGGTAQDATSGDRARPNAAFENLIGREQPRNSQVLPAPPTVQTRDQILEEARILATPRADLSGTFVLANGLGEWDVRVLETTRSLTTANGVNAPAVTGQMTGREVEVLVNRDDSLFRDFGRDVRDVALVQAAEAIANLTRAATGIAVVYAQLVKSIDDLKVTPIALQEGALRLLNRVKELMFEQLTDDPESLWEALDASDKNGVEMRAAGEYPNDSLPALVDDGRFMLLLDGKAIVRLVQSAPLRFFDNRVFKASLEHRPMLAQEKLVKRVLRNLEGLSDFLDDSNARQTDDLVLVRVQSESLARQLRSTDRI